MTERPAKSAPKPKRRKKAAVAEPTARPAARGEGWSVPRPAVIPRATPWPAALALGVTVFATGLVTSNLLFAAGALIFAVSLAGWIGEMRHERRQGS